jgi:hypothetical protein
MKQSNRRWLAVLAAVAVPGWVVACSEEQRAEGGATAGMEAAPQAAAEPATAGAEEGGEHARAEGREAPVGGEHGEAGEREESGVQIGRENTWDATRNGARLVLSFDAASGAFLGTIENTTRQTLCAVRVEVHLSSGTELGPTERTDLGPGETMTLTLGTGGEAFDSWTAHPEVSPCRR